MSAPKRIQRKRTKGWRMPEGAVYVGRGSRWGNPFRWESLSTIVALERGEIARAAIVESPADAVQMFRHCFLLFNANLAELRGTCAGKPSTAGRSEFPQGGLPDD